MDYRVWYSTESFADYIIENTRLNDLNCIKSKIFESDANNPNNFHTMPDHIKQILYLDAPDLIVEVDSEPIFSIEVSTEAGTGHNAFQRFARIAAAVENGVPAFYIYPQAAAVTRINTAPKWDVINPLIFRALDDVMSIYKIPALLYYFPSDYKLHQNIASNSKNINQKGLKFDSNRRYSGCPDSRDPEMKAMFDAYNEIINSVEKEGTIRGREKLLGKRVIIDRVNQMRSEYSDRSSGKDHLAMSPLSTTRLIPTSYLLKYLSTYEEGDYRIGELLKSRKETLVYSVDAKFRGDPYPGALAAIDYLRCRQGKSFEERKYNLIMAWGRLEIDSELETIQVTGEKPDISDFFKDVSKSEDRNLLSYSYSDLKSSQIPRYYMQVRYGSSFSKVKHIRVYSYFADAIIFPNGALWRDA